MKSTEFTGRSSAMKIGTPWLSAEDLLDAGDVNVIIEKVFHHTEVTFDDGRKVDVYAVQFAGKEKQLVLNTTNRKTLVALFSTNVKDWKGKRITLFVDENVAAFGKTVCGIRIRRKLPPQDKPVSPEDPETFVEEPGNHSQSDDLSLWVDQLESLTDKKAIMDELAKLSANLSDPGDFEEFENAAKRRIEEIAK